MNLFILDNDPCVAAQGLDDKRVGKLLMECNQMMSLALKEHSENWASLVSPEGLTNGFAHKNHPVSVWVRQNISNYEWTWNHASALAKEFELRFGKIHASSNRLPLLWAQRHCLPDGDLLPFQNSARNDGLGIDYTHLPVPFSYQAYIQHRWLTDKKPVTFTNRGRQKMSVSEMRISSGLRVGFWYSDPVVRRKPFVQKGTYVGPDLGSYIPGDKLEQKLMEGTLKFRVGVLFRPDLDKRNRLETILILENWIPEMFEYSDWESLDEVASQQEL